VAPHKAARLEPVDAAVGLVPPVKVVRADKVVKRVKAVEEDGVVGSKRRRRLNRRFL
jgi:hypothetical protein